MGLSREHAAQSKDDELWRPEWQESYGEKTIQARSRGGHPARGGGSAAPVKLYTSWFCEFAHRAWITLEEKGVDYEYIEVNPYEVCSYAGSLWLHTNSGRPGPACAHARTADICCTPTMMTFEDGHMRAINTDAFTLNAYGMLQRVVMLLKCVVHQVMWHFSTQAGGA